MTDKTAIYCGKGVTVTFNISFATGYEDFRSFEVADVRSLTNPPVVEMEIAAPGRTFADVIEVRSIGGAGLNNLH